MLKQQLANWFPQLNKFAKGHNMAINYFAG
jgi:hypothetical protein